MARKPGPKKVICSECGKEVLTTHMLRRRIANKKEPNCSDCGNKKRKSAMGRFMGWPH